MVKRLTFCLSPCKALSDNKVPIPCLPNAPLSLFKILSNSLKHSASVMALGFSGLKLSNSFLKILLFFKSSFTIVLLSLYSFINFLASSYKQ